MLLRTAASETYSEDPLAEQLRETTNLLIEAGAHIDLQGSKGNTPLHLAATSKLIQIIKTLIKYNAAQDCQNDEKKIPYDLVNGSTKKLFNAHKRKRKKKSSFAKASADRKKKKKINSNN